MSQTVQLLELDYARPPRQWRVPWRRLLVVAALVIAAPFVFRRAMNDRIFDASELFYGIIREMAAQKVEFVGANF